MKKKSATLWNNKRSKFACLCALLLVFTAGAMERIDGVAAVVGDSTILRSEVEAFTYMLANQMGQEPDSLTINMLRKRALEELINGKVLLVKAEKDTNINIRASDVENEVDSRISMILKQNGIDMETFGQMLQKQQNMNVQEFRSELRRQIKQELIRQHVQQMYVSSRVTKNDVASFYEQYKDSLPTTGKSVKLSKIFIDVSPSQSVREQTYKEISLIKQKLNSGQDFAELAKEHSEGPNAKNGGNLGYIAKGTLSELTFEEKIFSLGVGQVSEPFETRLGWHIVKILSKKDQQVEVQQIFIGIEADEETVENKKAILDSLAENSLNQQDFITAVNKYSSDKVSRSRDGSIGWKSVDALSPQLKKVISEMEVGQITSPIREGRGWSVYRIDDRAEKRQLTLEEDYNEIAQIARRVITQEKLKSLVEKWRRELYVDIRL